LATMDPNRYLISTTAGVYCNVTFVRVVAVGIRTVEIALV